MFELVVLVSNEFSKAEIEGGIFFYNFCGVFKIFKVDGEFVLKVNGKVKK